MLSNGMLDQFPLPEVARDGMRKFQSKQLDDGVDMFMAHDQGIAYRFFIHADYNKVQSKILKYEKFDEITMIEWLVDKRTKPTERVKFLPTELLSFDEDTGECIGGLYKRAYESFLQGVNTPGLPLSKWGVLGEGECASLIASGIFSVEQFAAQPRSKIEGKYPAEIVEAFERAQQYVNGKAARVDTDKHAAQILALEQEKSKMADEVAAMKEQLAALMKGQAPKKKRIRGPNKPKVMTAAKIEVTE